MNDVRHASSEVVVQARGEVSETEREYARDKIDRLRALAVGPVLFARIDLTAHADPARDRPAFAKAELDVNGQLVRAHVAAATIFEAVDLLEARLRVRLERFAHRPESKHLRLRGVGDHEWRHGDESAPRPSYFPRPVEERDVLRHKTFSVGEITLDQAALDLEALDHDFFLFKNAETGEDATGPEALTQHGPDGTLARVAELMERANVGALVVLEASGLAGIVTDRDVVVRGVAHNVPADARIDSVMTTDVITLHADADLRAVLPLFRTHASRGHRIGQRHPYRWTRRPSNSSISIAAASTSLCESSESARAVASSSPTRGRSGSRGLRRARPHPANSRSPKRSSALASVSTSSSSISTSMLQTLPSLCGFMELLRSSPGPLQHRETPGAPGRVGCHSRS